MKTLKYSEVESYPNSIQFTKWKLIAINYHSLSKPVGSMKLIHIYQQKKKKMALVDKPRNNKRKRRKKITWKSSGLRFALSREWSESYPQREPSFKAFVSTLTSPLSASISWVFSIFFLLLLSQWERERQWLCGMEYRLRILTGSDDCLSLNILEVVS